MHTQEGNANVKSQVEDLTLTISIIGDNTSMKYEWFVRCKSCNFTFVSEKFYLKSKISNHLSNSHKKVILPEDIRISDIHEEGIILARIPRWYYEIVKEQMDLSPSFWSMWRNLFKTVKKLM